MKTFSSPESFLCSHNIKFTDLVLLFKRFNPVGVTTRDIQTRCKIL